MSSEAFRSKKPLCFDLPFDKFGGTIAGVDFEHEFKDGKWR